MSNQLRADDVEAAASDVAEITVKFCEVLTDFRATNPNPLVSIMAAAATLFASCAEVLDVDAVEAFEQLADETNNFDATAAQSAALDVLRDRLVMRDAH